MKPRKEKPKAKWGGGSFNAFPHRVLVSEKFATLSPQATKLLMDLFSQYRGSNNGDLCAAFSLMEKRGWKSKSGLAAAIKELIKTGFLVLSCQGGRHKPSLYALTFYAIDECADKRGISKHDLRATQSPNNDWLCDTPVSDLKEAQKRKKRADIIELKNHLKVNPDDKYAENYRQGISELERQVK